MTRDDVIKYLQETDLVETCLRYQTKGGDPYLVEELRQELWLWLMTYKEEKLLDAFRRKHINAIITTFIRLQFKSRHSPFYKVYRKKQKDEVDLLEAVDVPSKDIE